MTVFRETLAAARPRWSVTWVVSAALAAIPVVFIALTIVGAMRGYSPVPYWDMWDAYLGSYLQLYDGHWVRYLLDQTNEHRIPLSKILFWFDLRFFGGESRVLVPANIALLAALWMALSAAVWALLPDRKDLWAIVCAGTSALCFSWMQMSNIVWGFQSQWLLAYLVPLFAFVSLARSIAHPEDRRWFVAAILCGVVSIGTMANGIFVLPLLVVMQLLAGPKRWQRAAVIGAVGIGFIALWFAFYTNVDRGPIVLRRVPGYLLSFLGLPFYRATHRVFERWPLVPEYLSYAGGVAFIAAAVNFALWWLKTRKDRPPLVPGLLMFIAYLSGTALVISLSRQQEARLGAMVDRYATLSLLGWATLAVLAAYRFKAQPQARKVYAIAALAVGILMLPNQIKVLIVPDDRAFAHEKTFAGLALAMHVDDVQSIKVVYPVDNPQNKGFMTGYVDQAERHKLTIFGDPKWIDAIGQIGRPASGHPCRAAVEKIEPVEGDARYRLVRGWAFDDTTRHEPQFVYFASGGTVVGVAVTGFPRDDVAHAFRHAPGDTGITGYFTADAATPLQVMCR